MAVNIAPAKHRSVASASPCPIFILLSRLERIHQWDAKEHVPKINFPKAQRLKAVIFVTCEGL